MGWRPSFRFDFVRTELEYAPPHQRREMVKRVLREYLLPEGRRIVCSYGSSRRPSLSERYGWDYAVTGEAEALDTNGVIFTLVAWTDLAETY